MLLSLTRQGRAGWEYTTPRQVTVGTDKAAGRTFLFVFFFFPNTSVCVFFLIRGKSEKMASAETSI